MALPNSTTPFLNQALNQILGRAAGIKADATNALAALQGGPVTTSFVFNMIDQMNDAISTLNRFKNTTGLNTYATAQVPNYAGTMTTDINAVISAAQACIDWVVSNFPKDNTNTWLLAYQLAADGTRSQRSFSTAQTSGLQTLMQSLIATIQ